MRQSSKSEGGSDPGQCNDHQGSTAEVAIGVRLPSSSEAAYANLHIVMIWIRCRDHNDDLDLDTNVGDNGNAVDGDVGHDIVDDERPSHDHQRPRNCCSPSAGGRL